MTLVESAATFARAGGADGLPPSAHVRREVDGGTGSRRTAAWILPPADSSVGRAGAAFGRRGAATVRPGDRAARTICRTCSCLPGCTVSVVAGEWAVPPSPLESVPRPAAERIGSV